MPIERYPLYFGERYPPGERCPSSCVLGEARSAPRGVLSRLKFLTTCTPQQTLDDQLVKIEWANLKRVKITTLVLLRFWCAVY